MTTAYQDILPQAMLDQLFEQGLYAIRAADAAAKEGVAEAASARGQAFLDVGTLMGDFLDASSRSALARAPLDLLVKFVEMGLQLQQLRERNAHELILQAARLAAEEQLERLRHENSLALETLRGTNELAAIAARGEAEIDVLNHRRQINDESWDEYLAFVRQVQQDYDQRVELVLGHNVSGEEEYIQAVAEVIAAKASAIRQPILPPAPPRI